MNYGFLIRNDRCIGCHACSTACKSENEVPLGVNRTWVKYVEVGTFPSVRRNFQVTRCNHCANPPCVRICPVTAMYQREDGIVEFDPDVCIGCKACLQACPYDAIYVDPDSGTAAKCHYCGHRVDLGLEPACVVVCPEHAIIAGDVDDPESELSRMLVAHQVTVRKPEQGTAPKLFYVDGDDVALTPTATERTPDSYLWADVIQLHGNGRHDKKRERAAAISQAASNGGGKRRTSSGTPIRTSQKQGVPTAGPIIVGEGRMAEQMVQVAYNAQHKIPWHWPVPAYLVTKAISAGLFLLLAVGHLLNPLAFGQTTLVVGGGLAVLFAALTTVLLVYDLERPERFLRIIFRPQWKSWLVRGAFLLIGFSTIAGLWWLVEAGVLADWWAPAEIERIRTVAFVVGIPFALGAAVYTAFLFGQAEGRDLWQSTLLPIHLVIQALMSGSAAMLIVGIFADIGVDANRLALVTFVASVVLNAAVTLLGEFGMPHASETAARAAKMITHGTFRTYYWGSLVLGHVGPLLLVLTGAPIAIGLAGILAIVGLYLYEYAFVMAPQMIPNS